MVTSNVGPSNLFKIRSVMSESPAEKYIRARKRQVAAPICLFTAPSEQETDEFFTENKADEMTRSKERLSEKYDLPVSFQKLLEFSEGEDDSESRNILDENIASSSSNDVRESLKFQPTIITEDNPAPTKNLFSPIDKVEAGTSTKDARLETTATYWQALKRRRSSEEERIRKLEKKTFTVESSQQTGEEDLFQPATGEGKEE